MDINVVQDIIPISDFKANAAAVMERINKTKRPAVITVNGKTGGVLLDGETYQAILAERERQIAIAHIRAGLADVEAGRFYKGSVDDLFDEINKELGL